MAIKYKVNELAKDLNVPAKDIIGLIEKYLKETKKTTSALTVLFSKERSEGF